MSSHYEQDPSVNMRVRWTETGEMIIDTLPQKHDHPYVLVIDEETGLLPNNVDDNVSPTGSSSGEWDEESLVHQNEMVTIGSLFTLVMPNYFR